MERRQFTREFKLEAVKLVKDRSVSYARAAEDLGVHRTQLRNWVKALADDPQHFVPRPGPDEARAVGDRASQARGAQAEGRTRHPKNAAAYFAKEST
jgi:transposase